MTISRLRERMKNLILFHTGTKFDSEDPDDVVTAEKIAANGTIALMDYLDAEGGKGIGAVKEELRSDAEWWNPNPEELPE